MIYASLMTPDFIGSYFESVCTESSDASLQRCNATYVHGVVACTRACIARLPVPSREWHALTRQPSFRFTALQTGALPNPSWKPFAILVRHSFAASIGMRQHFDSRRCSDPHLLKLSVAQLNFSTHRSTGIPTPCTRFSARDSDT